MVVNTHHVHRRCQACRCSFRVYPSVTALAPVRHVLDHSIRPDWPEIFAAGGVIPAAMWKEQLEKKLGATPDALPCASGISKGGGYSLDLDRVDVVRFLAAGKANLEDAPRIPMCCPARHGR